MLTLTLLADLKSKAAASQPGKPRVEEVDCAFINHYSIIIINKTISDGGITVDFWIIKVYTSN